MQERPGYGPQADDEEPDVEQRRLGRSGCAVSSLCLGTMTFGNETDEQGAFAQLDRFAEAGGTLVDTADVYTAGAAERIVGRWLAARPVDVTDRVVLATKGRFPVGDGPNDLGTSRRHLRRALDASLTRLGVEHVDLYQLHAWDPHTPLEESLGFLDDAVRAGKVGYPGLSNFTGWQLQLAVDLAAQRGWAVPVTLQPSYSLLVREIEHEIVPACLYNGLGLLPWSPLAGGWLSGKYSRDARPTGATRLGEDPARGMEAYDRVSGRARTWDVLEAVQDVAEARGASMAQVALAWVRDRPGVSSVILGARTLGQLEANLAAADVVLTQDETARLDAVSDPRPADYPYGGPAIEQRSRGLAGRGGVAG
ncbi:MAG: aldo/keto reductase [Frankiales bacterium]|nr:aldo/keto reductase [Frankiales bacterium]